MATSRSKKNTRQKIKESFEDSFYKDDDYSAAAIQIIPVDSTALSDQEILSIATALFSLIPEETSYERVNRPWSNQNKMTELR